MKKIVVTSLVALSLATAAGIGIGLAVNHPVSLNTKNASSIQTLTTSTTPPASSYTSPTTTSQTQPVAQPTPINSTSTTTTATSTPVTVTAYKQIPIDDIGNIDCEFTYSDGTTYQWHWTVVNPQGDWVTDGQGENGHWVATTGTVMRCDDSVLGQVKSM